MAWARLDDRLNDADSKLLALTDAAHRMYTCGLVYVSKALTDGFIPEHVIETFGVRARNKHAVAEELCTPLIPGKHPLWHHVAGGYQVHNYLDWNDDKETIVAKRQRSADRVSRFRDRLCHTSSNALQSSVTSRVTDPPISPPVTRSVQTDPRTTYLASLGATPYPVFDGDLDTPCGYCGATSRQTKHGLEPDHFVPRSAGGPDAPANIIWACHRCNQAKGRRVFESVESAKAWLHHAYWTSNRQRWVAHRPLAFGGQPPTGVTAIGSARDRHELRKQAKLIRDKAWGRCRHDPPCADYASCLVAIAEQIAEQIAAKAPVPV